MAGWLWAFCAAASATLVGVGYEPCSITPPRVRREMRAAWVATVSNIDWPSTNSLTTAQQKAELVAILDRAANLKLNAIFLQVRPGCDAMYASTLEPWSEYLTGAMGRAPQPYYDPLAFAVEEAHKRGLELHAWFNPYRARHSAAKGAVAPTHISRTRPGLVRVYGRSLWLDPGEPEVQNYSLSVVLDVVRRYDIDGVHFDDYFYPYKEKDVGGKDIDFPDQSTWLRFGAKGKLSRQDWRRQNVNAFIRRVYEAVKATKSWVRFGISPFGIWRPGYPAQIEGYDAYANLYADSRKWLANGWVDYLAPQLYWGIAPPAQSFPVLLRWWTEQNRYGRLIVPGMDSTKTGRRWGPEEIVNQIKLARQQPGAMGHIHWNMSSLLHNSRLTDALKAQVYLEPALVPTVPRLMRASGPKPILHVGGSAPARLSWTTVGKEPAWLWLVQARTRGQWRADLLPGAETSQVWQGSPPEFIAITAVDRAGNCSRPAAVKLGG